MEPTCDVHWYSFAWNDVLRLPMPDEVRRAEIEVFIDREADTLGYWREREPHMLGLFPWTWVREDLHIAEWCLGDWFLIFRDLRIYFYVHEAGEGQRPSIHVLAVQEDGAAFSSQHLQDLLERREEVLALIGAA